MNDTHGQSGTGWYGFDLDGTLAVYDKWEGIDHIGEPVKPMVDLIKKMHGEGKVVKILTARVAPRPNPETKPNPHLTDQDVYRAVGKENEEKYRAIYRSHNWGASEFIADWCLKNLGFLPEITHRKDHLMLELYDDRVKQVVPNTGILVEDIASRENLICKEQYKILHDLDRENTHLLLKLDSKINGFSAGFSLATLIFVLVQVGMSIYGSYKQKTVLSEAEKNLDTAIHAYIEAKVK